MQQHWRTSSYSQDRGNCVECRTIPDRIQLRDSQHPHQGQLSLPAREWAAFLSAARREQL